MSERAERKDPYAVQKLVRKVMDEQGVEGAIAAIWAARENARNLKADAKDQHSQYTNQGYEHQRKYQDWINGKLHKMEGSVPELGEMTWLLDEVRAYWSCEIRKKEMDSDYREADRQEKLMDEAISYIRYYWPEESKQAASERQTTVGRVLKHLDKGAAK